MESLKRVIENETQALMTRPVINLDVSRIVFIRNIEPKTLIDYALANDLGKPEISQFVECLEVTLKTDNGIIVLQSSKLKVKTEYTF